MSEIGPSVVAVTKLLFEMDVNSPSPVTLRVKPDRRCRQIPFPEAVERRLSMQASRLSALELVAPRTGN